VTDRVKSIVTDLAANKDLLAIASKQLNMPELEVMRTVTNRLMSEIGKDYYYYLTIGSPRTEPEAFDHAYALGKLIGKYFIERK